MQRSYLVCGVEVVERLANSKTNSSDIFLTYKLHKRLDGHHLLHTTANLFNPLEFSGNYTATSNNMAYEVGTLAVRGWAVTFGTARRGQAPHRCIKM